MPAATVIRGAGTMLLRLLLCATTPGTPLPAGLIRPPGVTTALVTRHPITGRQLYLELDDLVPHLVAAVPFRDGKQFTQAAARIERRGCGGSSRFRRGLDGFFREDF